MPATKPKNLNAYSGVVISSARQLKSTIQSCAKLKSNLEEQWGSFISELAEGSKGVAGIISEDPLGGLMLSFNNRAKQFKEWKPGQEETEEGGDEIKKIDGLGGDDTAFDLGKGKRGGKDVPVFTSKKKGDKWVYEFISMKGDQLTFKVVGVKKDYINDEKAKRQIGKPFTIGPNHRSRGAKNLYASMVNKQKKANKAYRKENEKPAAKEDEETFEIKEHWKKFLKGL